MFNVLINTLANGLDGGAIAGIVITLVSDKLKMGGGAK